MKSYFKGTKVKRTYEFSPNYIFDFYRNDELIDYFDYYEADLEIPPLKKDDKFFIDDKNEIVNIKDVMRSVKGNKEVMVYIINKEEIVEDIESKKQAELDKETYYKQREESLKENMKKEEEINTTWWDRFRTKWL